MNEGQQSEATGAARRGAAPLSLPMGWDPVALLAVLAGLAALYGPTFWDWAYGPYANFAQGHEALVIIVSAALLFLRRHEFAALRSAAAPRLGGGLLAFGLLLYALGRTLAVLRLELVSLLLVVAGLLICFKGLAAVRVALFPLLFLLFAYPLPYELVLTLTGPLKEGVSVVATQLLFWLGYPIGQSGVVITLGQYELLVAEACAGLQTMFTLEAMGLLYASLTNHASWVRNALLAILVVPVAFAANVVRVMVLALITYHFGGAAGQGFMHGFAGIVLFTVALLFIFAVDGMLGRLLPRRGQA